MVFNILIISILIILIIHYSLDYIKSLLNPVPPSLEDLKYKKYKTIIDEISKPKVVPNPETEPIPDADTELELETYLHAQVSAMG
jgi:hypothetical protein